ncbi:hypothetical protein Pmani_010205 [Petrolisthes manimaculis]|uniref:RNase H type-1 domain-containing protein n=1 Tax=Petrolisthes manimaculis TaxID=1843537 RepID=A0AAE1UCW2_9EUCA|nr:hypothetical protein Pmani_010205 [Petrolisthes manimaculis]
MSHIITQCKSRLHPLRCLAWSGTGVGAPVLRTMYVATVRSIIDYASPVLSCLGDGRLEKIEKVQNQAMRIILNCPKNAMIDAMRMELNLESLKNIREETNLIAALRHVRAGGQKLEKCINDGVLGNKTFWRQGKRGYLKELIEKICKYNLLNCCSPRNNYRKPPPWDDKFVDVTIPPLVKKKCMYSVVDLKKTVENNVSNIDNKRTAHVYCDGSIIEDGKAGCGVLVIDSGKDMNIESEYSYRIADNVSSTQAELCAILCGLREVRNGMGDLCFFVDSQSALESLNSKNPVYEEVVNLCKGLIEELEENGRNTKFRWIPSHIGFINNERADELAKKGTEKENIDMDCITTLKQIKTIIRKIQSEEETPEHSRSRARKSHVVDRLPVEKDGEDDTKVTEALVRLTTQQEEVNKTIKSLAETVASVVKENVEMKKRTLDIY